MNSKEQVPLIPSRAQVPSGGQGTVEYLVILAVIVVIGLVVVGLSTSIVGGPAQQLGNAATTLGSIAKPVRIVDAVSDPDGNTIIRLQNNSGDSLTVTKVGLLLNGVETNDLNYNTLLLGNTSSLHLTGTQLACPCLANETKKVCTFLIYTTNQNNIQNKITITVTTDCVSHATTPNPPVEPIDGTGPIIYLLSPTDNNISSNSSIRFDYNATDNTIVSRCTLRINGTDVNTKLKPLATDSFTQSFSGSHDGLFSWTIYCTDPSSNTTTPTTRTLNLDLNYNEISYCQELQNMNTHMSSNFVLVSDVNCYNDTHVGGALYNGGLGFDPIGYCSLVNCSTRVPFTGNFDGNNYTIYGLYINRPSASGVGLFGNSTGIISNVKLVDVNVTGGSRAIGGLSGYSFSTITKSSVAGNVYGPSAAYVGGMVGRQEGGSISNSFSSTNVYGSVYIGGLVGFNFMPINNCYAVGNINGTGYSIGGLVGGISPGSGPIYNSYSTGIVNGNSGTEVGGFAGEIYGQIYNSFSTGTTSGAAPIGGLVGYYGSTISNSYWDTTLTGQGSCYSGGSTGCTPTTGNEPWYYTDGNAPMSSWTFGNPGTDANWSNICNGVGYPSLMWEGITNTANCRT